MAIIKNNQYILARIVGSDQKLAKFKESFPRKVRKTCILTGFRRFYDERDFFSKIRLGQFVPHIDSQLHAKQARAVWTPVDNYVLQVKRDQMWFIS